MKIGVCGLGKLGLPVALALEGVGHDVKGYDPSPIVADILDTGVIPYQEVHAQEFLHGSQLEIVEPAELAAWADLVMVAVQTPHQPQFEGVTPITREPEDFDYSYLTAAVESVRNAKLVVVVSTVLPGTMERLIKPIVSEERLLYNPSFIAMGTTIDDFYNPEFVLVGTDGAHAGPLREMYAAVHDRPLFITGIKNAELTKVIYNAAIGLKIALANSVMEIADKIGADCDEVTSALALATDRVISAKYLYGGMGDGGGCFPPDEIVITENGPRPISDISVGDLVLSGDGSLQPVLKVWQRDYDDDLVIVKARGLPECRMTLDHPVMASQDLRKQYDNGRRRSDIFPVSELHETRADELTLSHLVYWPDHREYALEAPGHVTDEYLELAGWWLSEGSCELSDRRGRLRFDLHAREDDVAERLHELLDACAPERLSGRGSSAAVAHKVEGSKRSVRFGSRGLTEMLVADFGKGAANKRLPSWIVWGDADTARLILMGLIRGDAHIGDRGISYSTISRNLAWGVFMLMIRLGITPTLREIPERPGHQRSYEVRVRHRGQAKQLADALDIPFENSASLQFRTTSWRNVQRVSTEPYAGPVYNLWVGGTNTYVVSCGVVHNCHPRDQIALSWLARELNLSYDIFGEMVRCREAQTGWLAEKAAMRAETERLPLALLGKTYKPSTNLTVGSPAVLLANLLLEANVEFEHYDPHVDG